MKDLLKKVALLLSLTLVLVGIDNRQASAQGGQVSFQIFYDELSPYGDWVNDPQYGYVWIPYVDRDFRPYVSNGYWVNTEYGNTWYSDYEWGWAPFHYGRWFHSNRYGWAWVPGYEWGPAWVSWRQGGGYYGWAPLTPGIQIGIGVNLPINLWVFVPHRYVLSPRWHNYYRPGYRYRNIYNRTTIINNTYIYNNNRYYSGPSRRNLERYTRGRVPVRHLASATRPGRSQLSSRSLSLYRPNVRRDQHNARPSRVVSSPTRGQNRNVQQVRNTRPSNNNRQGTVNRTRQGTRPTAQRPVSQRSSRNTQATPATRSSSNRQAPAARSSRQQTPSRNGQAVRPSRTTGRSSSTRATQVQRPQSRPSSSRATQVQRPQSRTPRSSSATPARRSAPVKRSTASQAPRQRSSTPARPAVRRSSPSRSSGSSVSRSSGNSRVKQSARSSSSSRSSGSRSSSSRRGSPRR